MIYKNEKRSIRTDLAIETREFLQENDTQEHDGIKVTETEKDDLKITLVEILNEKGSEEMGKPIGKYLTIESQDMKENDVFLHEKIIYNLSEWIKKFVEPNLKGDGGVLVVGLGNRYITPDSLGPKVISKILVTRHLKGTLPDELENQVKKVAAISPGVMGITGIETAEIIKGVAKRINPSVIIAIDALAARRASRINSTIQMTDTGVCPGGGVGNKRNALNYETLNIPVIAIGVPTVVDAATLVNDTLDVILSDMISSAEKGSVFYETLNELHEEEKYNLIKTVLNPYIDNMFVTPKEIDAVTDRLTGIIANSINIALHPGITKDDINRFV